MPTKKAVARAQEGRDRRLLDMLTGEILQHKSQAARNIYNIGVRLQRIHDEALFRHGGHEGFEDYVQDVVDISVRSAYRFMRIARHFNAAIVARYGSEKLDAAIEYMQATPRDELPGDLLAADIRLRNDAGKFFTKPIHEATAIEIRQATTLVRDARRGSERIPRALQNKASTIAKALPAAPAGLVARKRVQVRRGRDGELAVSFAHVPMGEMKAFVEMIKKHLL